ncbi:hypothetical protein CR513_38988, partial [Mucuna pruriens]
MLIAIARILCLGCKFHMIEICLSLIYKSKKIVKDNIHFNNYMMAKSISKTEPTILSWCRLKLGGLTKPNLALIEVATDVSKVRQKPGVDKADLRNVESGLSRNDLTYYEDVYTEFETSKLVKARTETNLALDAETYSESDEMYCKMSWREESRPTLFQTNADNMSAS